MNTKKMRAGGRRAYPPVRTGERLNQVAFPLGGIGAGMVSLTGTGALSQVSVRHRPDVFNEPQVFAALHVRGARTARVLEGPVPMWKASGSVTPGASNESGGGLGGRTYGLPRFAGASFQARFPFAVVSLADPAMPVGVELTGWSPFTPGAEDDSSLPVAALEYRFTNRSSRPVKAVFSFHAANFMKLGDGASVGVMDRGFVLRQPALPGKPSAGGEFAAFTGDRATTVDAAWFRGGWWDALTVAWNHVRAGDCVANPPHRKGAPGNGASLYVPFTLGPGAARTIRLHLVWYVPRSELNAGAPKPGKAGCGKGCKCKPGRPKYYRPWYAARFPSLASAAAYWRAHYGRLRAASEAFRDCFHDTTLPAEAVESVAANLAILKTPTVLRQADGRLWGWEGCNAGSGCCHGSCTHVWNYAQAMPHLFPALERTLRETEFMESQDDRGHQAFRSALPIGPTDHGWHAAADGQLGGLMKLHREWRISGDTRWLRKLWPAARKSLDYCIETWDPERTGTLVEPHHNTYDIEFWGADGMCTSFYLGALAAAVRMGRACGSDVTAYADLLDRGRSAMATTLWNGDWFVQKVQWEGLRAGNPATAPSAGGAYSPEAQAVMRREGPKYQYGSGCLSDGVLGDWIARCCGVGPVLDPGQTARHLRSVYRHNFRRKLADHSNTQRPGYAFPQEGGLLLCSWPRGHKPVLPFVYSDEVWTGIEYQAAAHLIMAGRMTEGLAIVHAVRRRYDGRWRNPFDEYECGHWYARAMASYGLLQALSGARYDAVEQVLYLDPAVRGDFRAFISTARGFGTVGIRRGQPFVQAVSGTIPVRRIVLQAVRRKLIT
ncbi:MAG: GH116 family glycosyl hydrolase [Candidatus Coatesbacteria bacterium]